MKRIFSLLSLILFSVSAFSQVSSLPKEIDPEDSVKIIVDLSQLNQSLDHVQALLNAANDGEDMYFWTWKPAEHPAGHPLANGLGGAAWKNSNPLLVMKDEGNLVYSYTLVPTLFYEVDAATVYAEDIEFLVKPKDGGGYGDPDIKSEDLELLVDPPVTEKEPVFSFPIKVLQDDVYTVFYDNWREEKSSMQNLDPDDCYVYSECLLFDGSVLKVANFFDVGNTPELKMEYYDEGSFRLTIQPFDFFNVPSGGQIVSMRFVVMKKVYIDSGDRVDANHDVNICK